MLLEEKQKMKKEKVLLDTRQAFMNRVCKISFYFAHLLRITGETPVPPTFQIFKVALELCGALL
jgi:hypothetical protein